MIQYIRIQNFRSVKDIALELGPLNIVFGPNGCGKSNIYNAIHLLTAAAEGRLSGFISEEGGLENMMWSGERSPLDRHPLQLQIACRTDSFDYELQIGFPEKLPYPTQFMLDPIVKEENIWLAKLLPSAFLPRTAAQESGGVSRRCHRGEKYFHREYL